MVSTSCRKRPRSRFAGVIARLLVVLVWATGAIARGQAQEGEATPDVAPGARVLTSFEDIWRLTQTEQQHWHRVQLDYVVYYYDPLWQAMWGRVGEGESYLSLGSHVFPIKPGQLIQVEGFMRPARGMRVEQPKVKILKEQVPLKPVSTRGDVANPQRFNKRLVSIEGYVDRQTMRDASHAELSLIAEGRTVILQLLLRSDQPVPQLRDRFVRAEGVYFARNDEGSDAARIEIWVASAENIEIYGTLDRDPRFDLPATSAAKFPGLPNDAHVRVVGTVQAQQPGVSVTINEGGEELLLLTSQTIAIRGGDQVEAVGLPGQSGGRAALTQALVRPMHATYTSVPQLWELSEAEKQKRQRVSFDTIIHYYDPVWKVLWGKIGGVEDYLPLGNQDFGAKSGQRILLEGSVLMANGGVVENPRVTILEENVKLEPLPTRGAVRDTERFNKRWVVLEGYVDRQLANGDARHLMLDVVTEGRSITGRLLHDAGAKLPNWEGSFVRMKGVYNSTQDPTGALPAIELWVPSPEHVEMLGPLDGDERFALPVTPVEKLSSLAPGTAVRIAGVLRSQQSGRLIVLRDDTGQVEVQTAQSRPSKVGDAVEAIGVVTREGGEAKVGDALYRPSQLAPAAPPEGLPRLRLADQLRELAPEEAARSYPVQLSGVITWARPNADFFFIRDSSGGVCVSRPPGHTDVLLVGTRVDLTGVSAAGTFSPIVLASQVTTTSQMDLPEPRPVTLEQALTGIEDSQWVSMSGYVRAVEEEGPWMRIELTTSAGEFHAMIAPHERWRKLPGAVVRVRGVCAAITNQKRQLTGVRLWVASSRFIEIEEPVPEDPFAVTARSIASLRQFGALSTMNRRVRVGGVVVHHEVGRSINLQDGAEGLLVLSRDQSVLQPGDRIDAVGFPGRENSRVVLREAVVRRLSAGEEPQPVKIADIAQIDVELDGRLVRVDSTLLDVGKHDNGFELVAQQDDTIFEASLDRTEAGQIAALVPGSWLSLTGVYEVQFDEYRRPHEVRIQLRSPDDVVVLRHPPWWTTRRVLALAGVLFVVVVLGLGWVMALRRRVREQTGVIREQFQKEKAARLEAALARASKLESLGVLAGGIAHDFNNLLTVILGNVSLAKLDSRMESETVLCLTESERAAMRARDLTQQLLTFAKGGEPMRAATRLPDVVREAAQFALHGSKVRCEFEIAPDLRPADVDKGQIGQVVHNIIINASQAMPQGGLIHISLRNEDIGEGRSALKPGRYVKLSVVDNGSGIPPEMLARIFEPYFTTKKQGSGLGLATVYSIVKKHDGHVEVQSKLGEGTTILVWLPAAAAAKTGNDEANPPAHSGGRILLMDDEAPIRLLGAAVLKRAGFAVTAVNDGAAVVSEYAAASAAGRPFDLVILDLTVPGGMGGAEAMGKLREMDPDVCAIVSSGYSSDPVMANYRAHGFRGRVPKPYAADDLNAVVQSLMRERKSAASAVAG